jgi:signal transduction histidine kinase
MINSIKRSLYMLSGTLRGAFFIIIIACVIGIVLYTQQLVRELRAEARDIVEFYALTIQRIATADVDPKALGWVFENIVRRINFPLILAQPDGEPASWIGLDIPSDSRTPETQKEIKKILTSMARENPPVLIKEAETGEIISYLYYGDSKNVVQLSLLPYISIGTMGLLVLVAFVGFNSIKQSEQRFIWVGMAKETAHQLGTPVSSLLGWVEILRTGELTHTDLQALAGDMQMDVMRLEKVAARFSQIGSQSDLKVQDLQPIFNDIAKYFQRRLPQFGKEIKIVRSYQETPPVAVNKDLFEWVLENLVKNSIDALKQRNGVIEISSGMIDETRVFVDIRDNGIGVTAKRKRDIFKPGYSTKKRGWGLGLNLAKRIIEEYHNGRLFIKETRPGGGATMRIELLL